MAQRSARNTLFTGVRQFTSTPSIHLPPKKGQKAQPPRKASNSFTKKNKGGGKMKTETHTNTARYEKLQGPQPDLSFMSDFLPERLTQSSLGSPLKFTKNDLSFIKHTGIPPTLAREFDAQTQPHAVIRASTLKSIDYLDKAANSPSKDTRLVLHGDAGSGRSISLLQSVVYAQQSGYLVIYIPNSQHLVDSSYDYLPPSQSNSIWSQPALSASLLRSFAESNKDKLVNVKISQDYAQVKKDDSLYNLCMHPSKSEQSAVEVFEGVFAELNKQSTYPTLLAIDSLQALYQPTLYRDQHFNKLQPYQLSVTAKLLELISGRQQFSKGAIVAATSSTPTSMQIPPLLLAQLGLQPQKPVNPFHKWNVNHLNNSQGLKLVEMNKLSFAEAVGVFESLGKTLGLSYPMSDELLLSKFTEAGGSPKAFTTNISLLFRDLRGESGEQSGNLNGGNSGSNSSNLNNTSKTTTTTTPTHLQLRKIMEWLLAGGISGAASRTAVSPMERLKILQQVQSNSEYTRFWPSLLKMYTEEGFKGFYRGNYLNCLRIFPYSGIQFSTYEVVKVFLGGGRKDAHLSNLERLSAGAIAGCASVTATYPLDLVRSRLSIATASLGLESSRRDAQLGILGMGKKVYYEEGGIRALYRGSVVSCAGIAPYVGCSFAIYEALKPYVPVESNRCMMLLIGAVSGTISQTITYPCDVLRRKMQVNGIFGPKYDGSIDAVRHIVKSEGVKGLYRGIVANWMKGGSQ
ncbi:hypothetical protein E3P96_03754 [Wallemia ichthyophaga]|nr:hypothetical protein E3P96_03754 [Wallemia ichthyophaga]